MGLGAAFHARVRPLRFWILGAACAALPDLDVVAFRFGIPYEAPLGHRGASHSLVFAAALAAALAALAFLRAPGGISMRRAWLFLFLATASHGVLDAMTNGGLGVAFFWPWNAARHFLPFRPLEVSPLSAHAFFSARGAEILANELRWVWAPAALLAAGCLAWRRRGPRAERPAPR